MSPVLAGTGLSAAELAKVGAGGFFRPRHLAALGHGYRDLQRWLADGSVEQVGRGLYRLASVRLTQHDTVAAICARVPHGILCLLSALRYHGIGTQLPAETWIAIAHKARAPRLPEFAVRLVRFSGPSLRYGVTDIELEGVPARVTSPARTVVDCFRFRRLVGLDVAHEALDEVLRERRVSAEELWRAAEVCRAQSLLRTAFRGLPG
jgi:predicted transcriptional regulator of viral defense system